MGIDLYIKGNSKLDFTSNNFDIIYYEIMEKLNKMEINNFKYLKYAKYLWENGVMWDIDTFSKFGQNKNWSLDDDYTISDFNEDKEIEFKGPLGLLLTFSENFIELWDPPYRYKSWFEFESIHQNEWRKYIYTVIKTFGGDKAIYLPDSGIPSSVYAYFEGNFNELEIQIKKEYGESKKFLSEVTNEYYENYFLDKFNDIEWKINAPFEYYYPQYISQKHFSGSGYVNEKFSIEKHLKLLE
jgi:hypothetical protein